MSDLCDLNKTVLSVNGKKCKTAHQRTTEIIKAMELCDNSGVGWYATVLAIAFDNYLLHFDTS